LTHGHTRICTAIQKGLEGKFFVPFLIAKSWPCNWKLFCFRTSCPLVWPRDLVIYNISLRGGQSTSLANLFGEKNELPCLFCTWEDETHPHKVREMWHCSVHSWALQRYHTKARFSYITWGWSLK
jgi:hypothetical protein